MIRLPEGWTVSDGQLHIGIHATTDLATRFGAPLYVYDSAVMRARLSTLRQALRGFADVFYSAKANPNIEILKIFCAAGAGIEIASAAEHIRARGAGAPSERILFAGPAKTDEELEHTFANGLGELHLESLSEIPRAAAIASRLGIRQRVALRINPSSIAEGGALRMGGQPAPFGIDEEFCLDAAEAVSRYAALDLVGVHIYAGTQILDVAALRRQWAHGLTIARRIAAHMQSPLRVVDLGGGLGVATFAGEKPLDLDALSVVARELAEEKERHPEIRNARILVEPGRFLVAEAGAYLARVIDVKISRGRRYVLTNGGMHHHLAASGNLGQAIKRDFPVVAIGRMEEEPLTPTTLAGPLCTPLDVLARQAALPAMAPGDLVAVLQSGAYGLSASPAGFLSHPMPAEVLIDGDIARVIRPRGDFAQPMTLLP